MEINDRFLRTIREAVGPNFAIGLQNGQPVITVGRDTMPLREGLKRIKRMNITGSQFFDPTMTAATFPGSGAGFYQQLEELARSSSLSVEVIRHETKGDYEGGLTEAIRKEYGKAAFPIFRTDSTSVLRMYRGNKALTFDEIMRVMEQSEGLSVFAQGNPSKRLSDLISVREISGVFEGDAALRAAVYDPSKLYGHMAPGVARMAEEGIWQVPPRTIRKIAQQLEERAKLIEHQAQHGGLTDQQAYLATERAKAVRKKVKEVEEMAHGGRFNIRFAGIEGFDISDIMNPKSLGLLGQGKGDVFVYSSNELFDENFGSGYDIAGSFAGNTKGEFGRRATRLGKIKSTITLQTAHVQDLVRMNAQAFLASPDLYNIGQMEAFTQSRIDKFFDMVVQRGTLPEGMVKELKKMTSERPPDMSMLEFKRRQAFAHRALQAQQSGTLMDDPTLVKQLFANFREHLNKGADKGAFFFVPDALGGHITPFEMVERAGLIKTVGPDGNPIRTLRPGQITFVDKVGWVMNGADAVEISPALGGSDMDDLLQNTLRFDQSKDRLRVAIQRTPTAYGEIGVFDIDITDPAVRRILRQRIGPDEFDRRELGELFNPSRRDDLVQLLDGLFEPFDDMDELSARSIVKGTAEEIWLKNKEDVQMGLINKIIKHAEARIGQLGVGRSSKGAMTPLTYEDTMRVGQELEATRFQLESYANTRMLADFMRNAHARDLENLHAGGLLDAAMEAHVYQQETAIDLMVTGLSDPKVDIPGATTDIRKAIGRTAAAHNLLLDPELIEDRFKVPESIADILEGAREINPDITSIQDLLLDAQDERAFYTQAKIRHQRLVKAFDLDAERFAGMSSFFDSVYFDKSAQADAERLRVAHTLAKEKWDKRSVLTEHQMQDMMDEFGEIFDRSKIEQEIGVSNEVANMLGTMFEEDGTMGDRARRAVAAYLQAYGDDEDIFAHGALAEVKSTIISWYKTGKETLTEEQRRHLADSAHRVIKLEDIYDPVAGSEFSNISVAVDESLGQRRMAEKAADFATAAATSAGTRFENISADAIRSLWSNTPSLRKIGISGAIAIAGSFMYQATKGDRTPEDMQGPPLLPGGSAYEDDYYSGELPPGVGNSYISPDMSGVTYRVNVRGSYDPEVLRNRLEGITGASASGTIYSVPNPQSDIFDSVNEAFGR